MRDNSVSMAKGVAIILMVLVHARFSHYGDTYINMFHMPLFFFMSGYCFKEGYLNDFKNFAQKRIKGVYWSYLKWGLLFLLFHNLLFALNIYNGEYGYIGTVSKIYTIKDISHHALLMVRSMNGEEQLLGGYWFLHTYFFAAFISFITIWLFKKNIRLAWLGGVILLFLSWVMLYFDIEIPLYIRGRELLASAIIVSGFSYKQNHYHLEKHPIIIPIAALMICVGVRFWSCSMLSLTWQKVIPYYFSAIAGTLMVFALCKWFNKITFAKRVVTIVTYIGDRTLDILTWHFISFKIISIIIIVVYELPIARLAEFPVIESYAYNGWWIGYLIIGLVIPLIIEYFLLKLQLIADIYLLKFKQKK